MTASTCKQGSFEEFKAYTLDVVRGVRNVDPTQPKVWAESVAQDQTPHVVSFPSVEAGIKLVSAKNCALLKVIAEQKPRSVSELAKMTGRAEQNLMRTLRKLSDAGIVRLDAGERRSYRPVVIARKVHFEIDLLAG